MKAIQRIQNRFRSLDDCSQAAWVVAIAPVTWAICTVIYAILKGWEARL